MAQTFRQALYAKLASINSVVNTVGSSIYPYAIPETHDFDRDGPALTYEISSNPRGQVLTGSDGTSQARVTFKAWGGTGDNSTANADVITAALFNALNGVPDQWGDGSCQIMSVTQQDESDEDSRPQAGSDEWIRTIANEYLIRYRVPIPTLM